MTTHQDIKKGLTNYNDWNDELESFRLDNMSQDPPSLDQQSTAESTLSSQFEDCAEVPADSLMHMRVMESRTDLSLNEHAISSPRYNDDDNDDYLETENEQQMLTINITEAPNLRDLSDECIDEIFWSLNVSEEITPIDDRYKQNMDINTFKSFFDEYVINEAANNNDECKNLSDPLKKLISDTIFFFLCQDKSSITYKQFNNWVAKLNRNKTSFIEDVLKIKQPSSARSARSNLNSIPEHSVTPDPLSYTSNQENHYNYPYLVPPKSPQFNTDEDKNNLSIDINIMDDTNYSQMDNIPVRSPVTNTIQYITSKSKANIFNQNINLVNDIIDDDNGDNGNDEKYDSENEPPEPPEPEWKSNNESETESLSALRKKLVKTKKKLKQIGALEQKPIEQLERNQVEKIKSKDGYLKQKRILENRIKEISLMQQQQFSSKSVPRSNKKSSRTKPNRKVYNGSMTATKLILTMNKLYERQCAIETREYKNKLETLGETLNAINKRLQEMQQQNQLYAENNHKLQTENDALKSENYELKMENNKLKQK